MKRILFTVIAILILSGCFSSKAVDRYELSKVLNSAVVDSFSLENTIFDLSVDLDIDVDSAIPEKSDQLAVNVKFDGYKNSAWIDSVNDLDVNYNLEVNTKNKAENFISSGEYRVLNDMFFGILNEFEVGERGEDFTLNPAVSFMDVWWGWRLNENSDMQPIEFNFAELIRNSNFYSALNSNQTKLEDGTKVVEYEVELDNQEFKKFLVEYIKLSKGQFSLEDINQVDEMANDTVVKLNIFIDDNAIVRLLKINIETVVVKNEDKANIEILAVLNFDKNESVVPIVAPKTFNAIESPVKRVIMD